MAISIRGLLGDCWSTEPGERTGRSRSFWQDSTAAKDLHPGNRLGSHDGPVVVVEEVYDTEAAEPVYNCRIGEYHTYFVGQAAWGYAVWAHNACDGDLPRINGRRPINRHYAGQTHPTGVRFKEHGFPDFTPHAKAVVEIVGLTGYYAIDERLANRALGLKKTPEGYVWHHVEDGKTMRLVPRAIHNSVRHTGGAAVLRNGGIDE